MSGQRMLLSAIALVAILGTACGPTPTPAMKEVTLTAWTIGPDEPSYYRRDNLIAAGEAINKELAAEKATVRVKVEATFDTGAWGDFKQKFFLAAQAGTAPDIILSGHEDVAPWSDAGFILDLSDHIKKYWDKTYKDVIPGLWKSVEYKGKRWAIPQDTEARPMYFSKTLLKKLGWSDVDIAALPDKIKKGEFTLYDMLTVAKEAQDKGVVAKGYGYWSRPRKGGDFYSVYFAFGGEMQDPATGKLVVGKDALLKHFKFHYDTVFTFKTTPEGFIGKEWKDWHETVSKGDKVLFWNGGTWHWAEWTTKYLAGNEQHLWDNVGFALFPAGEKGKKPVTLSHPLVYMVTKSSKNPELAFRLLTLATTPELNTKHAVNSGHLAILTTQITYPEYAKAKFLQQTAYMPEFAGYQPNHADYGPYDTILWTALSAVMGGETTPEKAVDTVVKDLTAELKDKVVIQ